MARRRSGGGLGGERRGSARRGPVPGQQFVDPFCRVGGEAGEDVAEIGLGGDAVELGGLDQRVEGGGACAAVVRAGEQPVLAAEGDRAVILPISGRKSKFVTGGTDSTGAAFAGSMLSGASAARSFTLR
jgi:hypothetical protein